MKHFAHKLCFLVVAICAIVGPLVVPNSAWGQTKSKPVLVVSGKASGAVEFDLPALQAMKQTTFIAPTPWDTRPVKFSGPLLREVLAAAGVSGTRLSAVAVNDYAVTIPWSDTTKFDVILAIKMNDRDIPARTKGPVFLVYPFGSSPELEATVYKDRSIWQLKALKVE